MRKAARTIVPTLLALVTQAPAAFAQFEPLAFAICKKITADTARLKCFDEIGAAGEQKPSASAPPASAKWEIEEDKSPLDDSPQILASLKGSGDAMLVLRCKERRTEAAFIPSQFFYAGSRDGITALVRINDGEPSSSSWAQSTSGNSAFAPNAIQFIRLLPDGGKLFIRISGFQGRTADGLFNLGDVSAVKIKIEEACNWSTPKSGKLPVTDDKRIDPPAPSKNAPTQKTVTPKATTIR